MALVNTETVWKQLEATLDKLGVEQGLEILSYKRNRGVSLLKMDGDTFQVRERGYREEECILHREELPKKLKVMLKREFPRSRKLRVYTVADPSELEQP